MNPLSENMKRRLRNYIISGARNYNKYLADKVFKIVCEDGDTVEIRFFISDFKHLTGLYSDLKNNEFYKECIHGTISIGNINTKQKYDWNTLRHLPPAILRPYGPGRLFLQFLSVQTLINEFKNAPLVSITQGERLFSISSLVLIIEFCLSSLPAASRG